MAGFHDDSLGIWDSMKRWSSAESKEMGISWCFPAISTPNCSPRLESSLALTVVVSEIVSLRTSGSACGELDPLASSPVKLLGGLSSGWLGMRLADGAVIPQ